MCLFTSALSHYRLFLPIHPLANQHPTLLSHHNLAFPEVAVGTQLTQLPWLALLQMGPTVISYSSAQCKTAHSSGWTLKGRPRRTRHEILCLDLGSPKADPEIRIYVHQLFGRWAQETVKKVEKWVREGKVKRHVNEKSLLWSTEPQPHWKLWKTIENTPHGCPLWGTAVYFPTRSHSSLSKSYFLMY